MKNMILTLSGLLAAILTFVLALRGIVPSFLSGVVCIIYILYIIRIND